MKNIFVLSLLALIAVTSCNKKEADERNQISLEWLVGAENGEVTKEISVPAKTELILKMEDSSLCPRNGIEVKLERDDEVFFEEIITSIPYSKTFDNRQSSSIRISTKVVELQNEIVCVWLGNVKVKLSY